MLGPSLLILGLGLLLLVGRESSGQRRLQSKINALRAEGLPVDNASLKKYYDEQTDPQDTPRWLAALKTLSSDAFEKSAKGVPLFDAQAEHDAPLPSQPWAAEAETATREFLTQWKELHQEIQELALRAQPVQFPIEFDSIDTPLAHLNEMRQAIRLLHLRGKVALRDGDSKATRQTVMAMWGGSKILSSDPLLISQLVATAFDGMAMDLLKDGLKSGVLQSSELQELLPMLLAQTEIDAAWRSAVIGERALALPAFEDTVRAVGVSVPGRAQDTLLYLEIIQKAIELPTEDLDEFRNSAKLLETDLKNRVMGNWLTVFDSIMTGTLTPALHASASAFTRRALQHRLAAVAIGLRLFEQQHSRFPQTLQELSQLELGLEQLGPSTQTTFGYRVNEDGIAQLWSYNMLTDETVPAEPYATTDPQSSDAMWVWELQPRD